MRPISVDTIASALALFGTLVHPSDRVENYLHEKVCAGEMKVTEAQHLIATDWLSVWSKLESRP